jgi:hypothetical protein
MVINYAKKTNNCNEERNFSVVEANVVWRKKQTQKLIKAKYVTGPKHGYF